MIKLKEILQQGKKQLLNEATYVKGKMNVLLHHARRYLFDEGSISQQTIWTKWTKDGFIHNVTESFSVKEGLENGTYKSSDITKFENKIEGAFITLRRDVEKAHKKWEKSVEKATKPFEKEYTGV